VETHTPTYPETAPNPLFLLSRNTAGLPARGNPLVVSGSSHVSATTHPPGGATLTTAMTRPGAGASRSTADRRLGTLPV